MLHGWLPEEFASFALSTSNIVGTPSAPRGLTLLRCVHPTTSLLPTSSLSHLLALLLNF